MRIIKIGFSTPKKRNIISKAIKKIMKTPFSHVYICFYSESLDRYIIYQGDKRGVHFINKTNFDKYNNIVIENDIFLTNAQYVRALQSCVDYSGQQYGFFQLIGLGISLLLSKIGIIWKNKFKQGYICSEIVAQILLDSGIITSKDIPKDINEVTPKDLYELFVDKIY